MRCCPLCELGLDCGYEKPILVRVQLSYQEESMTKTLTQKLKESLNDLCNGDKNSDLRAEITVGTAEAMRQAVEE